MMETSSTTITKGKTLILVKLLISMINNSSWEREVLGKYTKGDTRTQDNL